MRVRMHYCSLVGSKITGIKGSTCQTHCVLLALCRECMSCICGGVTPAALRVRSGLPLFVAAAGEQVHNCPQYRTAPATGWSLTAERLLLLLASACCSNSCVQCCLERRTRTRRS